MDFSLASKLLRIGGDTSAYLEAEVTQLYDEYRRPLFRYLLTLGLNAQDGEEIIQEVFLALFRHLRNAKPRHHLRGWIFRVGHNQALQLQRRQPSIPELPGEAEDGSPDPEQQALASERQRRLRAVFAALPLQDQACLALRAERLSYREIAEVVGISLGGVANSLERSLAKLTRAGGL